MGEVVRYSEREQAWQRSELRVKNEQQLAQGFHVADVYLNRTYLDQFSAAPIVAANRAVMDISKLRIIEISKLVFDASERFTDKLMSVYSAIYNLDSSVALIIDSDGNKVRFYIGTRSDRNTAIAGDILEATLKGNFPGVVYKSLDAGSTNRFVADIKNNGIKSMAAVSVVPSIRENSDGEMEEFVQGNLEKSFVSASYSINSLYVGMPSSGITEKRCSHPTSSSNRFPKCFLSNGTPAVKLSL